MRLKKTVEIEAPPEEVWAFLVLPSKILEWYDPLYRFEYRSRQRDCVGMAFYFEEEAAGRLRKLNFEVTEWVEHQTLAFRMTSGDFFKDYRQQWTLKRTPTGTSLALVKDVTYPCGALGKLWGMLAKVRAGPAMAAMLAKLKGFAEEAHRSRPYSYV